MGADDYYPHGLQMPGRSLTGTSPTRPNYTGQELDAETHAGARYYGAALGRWGSVDPLGDDFPGFSPYSYAYNNPLRLMDPDGKAATCPECGGKLVAAATKFVNDMKTLAVDVLDRMTRDSQFRGEMAAVQEHMANSGTLEVGASNSTKFGAALGPVDGSLNLGGMNASVKTNLAGDVSGTVKLQGPYASADFAGAGVDAGVFQAGSDGKVSAGYLDAKVKGITVAGGQMAGTGDSKSQAAVSAGGSLSIPAGPLSAGVNVKATADVGQFWMGVSRFASAYMDSMFRDVTRDKNEEHQ